MTRAVQKGRTQGIIDTTIVKRSSLRYEKNVRFDPLYRPFHVVVFDTLDLSGTDRTP